MSEHTLMPTPVRAVVDPLDTCDACPSRPKWAAQVLAHHTHPLLFCGHHWAKNVGPLFASSVRCWPLHESEA